MKMTKFKWISIITLMTLLIKVDMNTAIIEPSFGYEITIITKLYPTFTFHGNVTIFVETTTPNTTIILDAAMDNITSCVVMHANRGQSTINYVTHFYHNQDDEKLTLHLSKPLQPKLVYKIFIEFAGTIWGMPDVYVAFKYRSNTGRNFTEWMTTSLGQPRHLFPCFDNKNFVTQFNLSLGHDSKYTSISNSEMYTYKILNTETLSVFEPTPKMSINQFAFALITGLDSLRDKQCNIKINELHHRYVDAIYTCSEMVQHFKTFFQRDLPTGKIDILPVSKSDLVIGNSGNGVDTRLGYVLISDEYVSIEKYEQDNNKIRDVVFKITDVVVRQWIYDSSLALMNEDVWIYEGIIAYLKYKAIENVLPRKLNMTDEFVILYMHDAMATDVLPNKYKLMNYEIKTNELLGIYNELYKQKSAAIIRMLSHILTEKGFNGRIISFLKKNPYGIKNKKDFFSIIQNSNLYANANDDNNIIYIIMNSWATNAGYPLVKISYENGRLHITQKRFDCSASTREDNNDYSNWYIPISYTTSTKLNFIDTTPKYWSTNVADDFESIQLNKDEWIIVNIQQTGYYRVAYDTHNWKLIINYLMNKDNINRIHVINRAQLIDDAFHLTRSIDDPLDIQIFLNLTKYLVNEIEYLPWKVATNHLENLINILQQHKDIYEKLRQYYLTLINTAYSNIIFNKNYGHGSKDALHQYNILDVACRLGNGNCVGFSKHYLNVWKNENNGRDNPISQNIRSIVYCAAIKYGGDAEWNFLHLKWKNEIFTLEGIRLISGLACSRNVNLLNTLITEVFEIKTTRHNELLKATFIENLSKSVEGRECNKVLLDSVFVIPPTDVSSYILKSLLIYPMKFECDKKKYNKIAKFVNILIEKGYISNKGGFTEAVNIANDNINWCIKFYDRILIWLGTETIYNINNEYNYRDEF